jgi:hypothetical protein
MAVSSRAAPLRPIVRVNDLGNAHERNYHGEAGYIHGNIPYLNDVVVD